MTQKLDYTGMRQEAISKLKVAMYAMDLKAIKYYVSSLWRSPDVQVAYYAQGRESLDAVNAKRKTANLPPIKEAENLYTITKCDGVKIKSNHQDGWAVDVVPVNDAGNPIWPPHSDSRWQPIADEMKKAGFKWGGDWRDFPDFPHYEINKGGKL